MKVIQENNGTVSKQTTSAIKNDPSSLTPSTQSSLQNHNNRNKPSNTTSLSNTSTSLASSSSTIITGAQPVNNKPSQSQSNVSKVSNSSGTQSAKVVPLKSVVRPTPVSSTNTKGNQSTQSTQSVQTSPVRKLSSSKSQIPQNHSTSQEPNQTNTSKFNQDTSTECSQDQKSDPVVFVIDKELDADIHYNCVESTHIVSPTISKPKTQLSQTCPGSGSGSRRLDTNIVGESDEKKLIINRLDSEKDKIALVGLEKTDDSTLRSQDMISSSNSQASSKQKAQILEGDSLKTSEPKTSELKTSELASSAKSSLNLTSPKLQPQSQSQSQLTSQPTSQSQSQSFIPSQVKTDLNFSFRLGDTYRQQFLERNIEVTARQRDLSENAEVESADNGNRYSQLPSPFNIAPLRHSSSQHHVSFASGRGQALIQSPNMMTNSTIKTPTFSPPCRYTPTLTQHHNHGRNHGPLSPAMRARSPYVSPLMIPRFPSPSTHMLSSTYNERMSTHLPTPTPFTAESSAFISAQPVPSFSLTAQSQNTEEQKKHTLKAKVSKNTDAKTPDTKTPETILNEAAVSTHSTDSSTSSSSSSSSAIPPPVSNVSISNGRQRNTAINSTLPSSIRDTQLDQYTSFSEYIPALSNLFTFNKFSAFGKKNAHITQRFSAIKNIHDTISLKDEGYQERSDLIYKFLDLVKKQYPDIQFHPFGSMCTKTAIVGSDIDIGFSMKATYKEVEQACRHPKLLLILVRKFISYGGVFLRQCNTNSSMIPMVFKKPIELSDITLKQQSEVIDFFMSFLPYFNEPKAEKDDNYVSISCNAIQVHANSDFSKCPPKIPRTPPSVLLAREIMTFASQQACTNLNAETNFLPYSSTPVLKFHLKATGMHVDFSAINNLAIRNSSILSTELEKDPLSIPLIVALKHFARLRGENTYREGVLSSFGYSLLVLNLVKHKLNLPPVLLSAERQYAEIKVALHSKYFALAMSEEKMETKEREKEKEKEKERDKHSYTIDQTNSEFSNKFYQIPSKSYQEIAILQYKRDQLLLLITTITKLWRLNLLPSQWETNKLLTPSSTSQHSSTLQGKETSHSHNERKNFFASNSESRSCYLLATLQGSDPIVNNGANSDGQKQQVCLQDTIAMETFNYLFGHIEAAINSSLQPPSPPQPPLDIALLKSKTHQIKKNIITLLSKLDWTVLMPPNNEDLVRILFPYETALYSFFSWYGTPHNFDAAHVAVHPFQISSIQRPHDLATISEHITKLHLTFEEQKVLLERHYPLFLEHSLAPTSTSLNKTNDGAVVITSRQKIAAKLDDWVIETDNLFPYSGFVQRTAFKVDQHPANEPPLVVLNPSNISLNVAKAVRIPGWVAMKNQFCIFSNYLSNAFTMCKEETKKLIVEMYPDWIEDKYIQVQRSLIISRLQKIHEQSLRNEPLKDDEHNLVELSISLPTTPLSVESPLAYLSIDLVGHQKGPSVDFSSDTTDVDMDADYPETQLSTSIASMNEISQVIASSSVFGHLETSRCNNFKENVIEETSRNHKKEGPAMGNTLPVSLSFWHKLRNYWCHSLDEFSQYSDDMVGLTASTYLSSNVLFSIENSRGKDECNLPKEEKIDTKKSIISDRKPQCQRCHISFSYNTILESLAISPALLLAQSVSGDDEKTKQTITSITPASIPIPTLSPTMLKTAKDESLEYRQQLAVANIQTQIRKQVLQEPGKLYICKNCLQFFSEPKTDHDSEGLSDIEECHEPIQFRSHSSMDYIHKHEKVVDTIKTIQSNKSAFASSDPASRSLMHSLSTRLAPCKVPIPSSLRLPFLFNLQANHENVVSLKVKTVPLNEAVFVDLSFQPNARDSDLQCPSESGSQTIIPVHSIHIVNLN